MNPEALLIVEDNSILREGLRDVLVIEGYTVLTASHGLEALQQMRARKEPPDLILSDIAMPEMDGFDFFNTVRSHPTWVSIPFIFLTAHREKEDVLKGKNLGAEDYLIKPISRKELITAVRARLDRSRQIQLAHLRMTYEISMATMASAIDLRTPFRRGRLERITANAVRLATYLGWNEERLEKLRFGAILHDIGRIHVPESILLKPGSLSEPEWITIRSHPMHGARMVEDIPLLKPAIPAIRNHHERWDGQGYPDGLAGEAIPIEARILAVADGFDAMTSGRPYKTASSPEQACQEVLRCSGKQYDENVVAAFEIAWKEGQIQAAPALES